MDSIINNIGKTSPFKLRSGIPTKKSTLRAFDGFQVDFTNKYGREGGKLIVIFKTEDYYKIKELADFLTTDVPFAHVTYEFNGSISKLDVFYRRRIIQKNINHDDIKLRFLDLVKGDDYIKIPVKARIKTLNGIRHRTAYIYKNRIDGEDYHAFSYKNKRFHIGIGKEDYSQVIITKFKDLLMTEFNNYQLSINNGKDMESLEN